MGMKTRQVKKNKPVSRINQATGDWETVYEEYYADESYWEPDTSSSSDSSSYSSGSEY